MIRKTAASLALLLALLPYAIRAKALDSLSYEYGRGNENTDLWRVGLQWNWPHRWLEGRAWTLGAYWDVQLGRWDGLVYRDSPERREVWDLGLTPVFRLTRAEGGAVVPYVEAAIGFHLISDRDVNFDRRFSTNFQFGDHIGAGVRLGEHGRFDASVRLQHLSNGGISNPNPGINFLQLRVMLHLR